MNLSMKWLQEFTKIPAMPMRDFTEAITMSGSKVEGWTKEGSEIDNVVVARVEKMERHPDSDHLWICQVNTGKRSPYTNCNGSPESERRRCSARRLAQFHSSWGCKD